MGSLRSLAPVESPSSTWKGAYSYLPAGAAVRTPFHSPAEMVRVKWRPEGPEVPSARHVQYARTPWRRELL
eukprot:scaffold37945_cov33-Tisochrysis_lutea.AAC.1